MTEYNKKLYVQRNGGGIEEITLYTTLSDVNDKGLTLNVDGINVYAGLGEISDSESSSLRCDFSGKTYGVLKRAGIKDGSFTQNTPNVGFTFNFTIPSGVKILAVTNSTYASSISYKKVTSGKTYTLKYNSYKGGAFGRETRYELINNVSNRQWTASGSLMFNSVTFRWGNAINSYTGTAIEDY